MIKCTFKEFDKKDPVKSIKETNLKCNSCKKELVKVIETDQEGTPSRGYAVCPCGGESFLYKANNHIISFCHNDVIIERIEKQNDGSQKIICKSKTS